MTKAIEKKLLSCRQRMIAVDLNVVKRGEPIDTLANEVTSNNLKILLDDLLFAELQNNHSTADEAIRRFLCDLKPLRNFVFMKRRMESLMLEEASECSPIVRLVSWQDTKLVRGWMSDDGLRHGTPRLDSARALTHDEVTSAPDIEATPTAKAAIIGGTKDLRSGAPKGDIRRFVEGAAARRGRVIATHMIKSCLHYVPRFLDLPTDRQRLFLLHSHTSRWHAAFLTVLAWYANRGRQGSQDGRAEENDMCDAVYAITGSLTGGLMSRDKRSVQPFVLHALRDGASSIESMSDKTLIESVAMLADELERRGRVGDGLAELRETA